jgi:hypothetical protein
VERATRRSASVWATALAPHSARVRSPLAIWRMVCCTVVLWCPGASKLLQFERRTPDCACVEQSWVCHRGLPTPLLIRCCTQPPGELRTQRPDSGASRTRPRSLGGCMTGLLEHAYTASSKARAHCLPLLSLTFASLHASGTTQF